MKAKAKQEGIISSGIMAGVLCELVKVTPAGTTVIKLSEPWKAAYKKGDIVHLSPGEFRPISTSVTAAAFGFTKIDKTFTKKGTLEEMQKK